MIKKIVILVAVLTQSVSFANQKVQNVYPFQLDHPQRITFEEGMDTMTFYVNPQTPDGKKSDIVTVLCNENKVRLDAGTSFPCMHPQYGYFELTQDDFKNGSAGSITAS